MTLRMVAGDSAMGSRRERVRLPTGSPVSTYCSTISRNTAEERASRPGGSGARSPNGFFGVLIGEEIRGEHLLNGPWAGFDDSVEPSFVQGSLASPDVSLWKYVLQSTPQTRIFL